MHWAHMFLAPAFLLLATHPVDAADLATQKQALDIIRDFAADFCKDPPLEGGSDKLELSGQGKAELDGLIAKLATLGIEGSAKYTKDSYKGIVQADLAKILASKQDCRLEIWRDLNNKMIVGQSDPNTQRAAEFIAPIDFARLRNEIEIPAVYSVALQASAAPNPNADRVEMQSKIRYSIDVIRKAGYGVRNHIYNDDLIAYAFCSYALRLNRNLLKFDVAARNSAYIISAELPEFFDLCQNRDSAALN